MSIIKTKLSHKINNEILPVFIIGAARSGTKFLRQLLSESMECQAIPYDINYIWRYGNESWPDDELNIDLCTDKIKRKIRHKIFHFINKHDNKTKYLIEKTVSNTLRIKFINEIFPNALFIHLIRDGREVTESSLRCWNEPLKYRYLLNKVKYFPLSNISYAVWFFKNNFSGVFNKHKKKKIWGPRYKGITKDFDNYNSLEICAKQWSECTNKALNGLSEIPQNRKIQVRYEKLVENEQEIIKICDFLKISDINNIVSIYNKIVDKSAKNKWENNFTTEELNRMLNLVDDTLIKLEYKDNKNSGKVNK